MFIEPTLKDFNKTFFAFFEGEREDGSDRLHH